MKNVIETVKNIFGFVTLRGIEATQFQSRTWGQCVGVDYTLYDSHNQRLSRLRITASDCNLYGYVEVDGEFRLASVVVISRDTAATSARIVTSAAMAVAERHFGFESTIAGLYEHVGQYVVRQWTTCGRN